MPGSRCAASREGAVPITAQYAHGVAILVRDGEVGHFRLNLTDLETICDLEGVDMRR